MTRTKSAASTNAGLLTMALLFVVAPLHAAEPAPIAPAPAASPSEPEPAPSAPARVAPTHRLSRTGSWLLSADDALPLFSVGASDLLSHDNAVRYGHPGGLAAPAPPSALTLDYVLGARFTIGASPMVESTIGSAGQSPQPYVTFEDFVASERDSETKHEW